jgi:SAM-dependent methyltransferase
MPLDSKDYFSSVAPSYARYRPHYPAQLFDWLATVAPARDRAWDCATGNGQAAVELAARFTLVVATDLSAQQIAEAEERPNIEYRVEPAESSELDARSVDLVTVAQALHWLPFDQFYREARRVLIPGGIIAAWTYNLPTIDRAAIDDLVRYLYQDVLHGFWAPERRYVDADYRDIPFPFDRIDAPSFSMTARWTLGEFVGFLRTWSAVASYRKTRGADPLDEIVGRLTAAWGEADVRQIDWPLSVLAGRAE